MTATQPRLRRLYQELKRRWIFVSRWRILVRLPLLIIGGLITYNCSRDVEPLISQIDEAQLYKRRVEKLQSDERELEKQLRAERDSLSSHVGQM